MADIGPLMTLEEAREIKESRETRIRKALAICGLPEELITKVKSVDEWTLNLENRRMSKQYMLVIVLDNYVTITNEGHKSIFK